MSLEKIPCDDRKELDRFIAGKTEHTRGLLEHFCLQFLSLGKITLSPAKTMVGIHNGTKRVAYITQLGKNFIHVVFPFNKAFKDNLCFQKIANVPGDKQFNHHFRMLLKEDVNEEVLFYMKKAFDGKE